MNLHPVISLGKEGLENNLANYPHTHQYIHLPTMYQFKTGSKSAFTLYPVCSHTSVIHVTTLVFKIGELGWHSGGEAKTQPIPISSRIDIGSIYIPKRVLVTNLTITTFSQVTKLKSVVTSVKLLASKVEDIKHQAKSLDDIIRALKKTISDVEAASIQETESDLSSITPVEEVQEVKSGNKVCQEATDCTDTGPGVEKPTATATMEGKIIIQPDPTDVKTTDSCTSTKQAATEVNPVCADQEMPAPCSRGEDTFAAESLAQPCTSAFENLSTNNNMISTTLSGMDLDVRSTSTAEWLSSNIDTELTTDSQGSEERDSCDSPVVLASQPDVKVTSKDGGELDRDLGLQDDAMPMEH